MSHHHQNQHGQSQSQPESPEALAYHLWEQAGRPEGQAAHFWSEAETQLKRSPQPAAGDLHLHHKGHGNAH